MTSNTYGKQIKSVVYVLKQAVYKLVTASQDKKRILGFSFGKSETGFYDEQAEIFLY